MKLHTYKKQTVLWCILAAYLLLTVFSAFTHTCIEDIRLPHQASAIISHVLAVQHVHPQKGKCAACIWSQNNVNTGKITFIIIDVDAVYWLLLAKNYVCRKIKAPTASSRAPPELMDSFS